MRLSVVIPVYNTQQYLRRCVDSVLAQTYADIEIVLVDDGSTDCSGAICDDYARRYANILTIHQANGGQAIARNVGVTACSGELVTFVDSDDYIADEKTYEYCVAAFEDGVDVVQYPYKTYHADPSENALFSFKTTTPALSQPTDGGSLIINGVENLSRELRCSNRWAKGVISTAVCDKMFRKEVISKVRFIPMFLEDVVAVVDAVPLIEAIKIIGQGEYAYCIRENSTLTSKWNEKKTIDELLAIHHTYELLNKYASDTPQQLVTFWWIVFQLTTLKKVFGVNYMRENPELDIVIPQLAKDASVYDKARMSIIKVIGLKYYIDVTANIGKVLSKMKR